jgi:hypothetical protein
VIKLASPAAAPGDYVLHSSTDADIQPPTILSARFAPHGGGHLLHVQFSEPVVLRGDSVSVRSTVLDVLFATALKSLDPTTNTATFSFGPGVLPDGRYVAGLGACAIRDHAGNRLDAGPGGGWSFEFHVLRGDLDGDGTVGHGDFLILRQNFGKPGDWSMGDLNGNGVVDFGDYQALGLAFGRSVAQPAPPPAAPRVPVAPFSRRPIAPRRRVLVLE